MIALLNAENFSGEKLRCAASFSSSALNPLALSAVLVAIDLIFSMSKETRFPSRTLVTAWSSFNARLRSGSTSAWHCEQAKRS